MAWKVCVQLVSFVLSPPTGAAPADAAPKRPSLSYDDLRRKNRGDYADTKQDPYR